MTPGGRFLYLRIAVGVLAVSFGAILVRLAGEAPSLTIAAWRLAAAALLLVPTAVVRRGKTLSPQTLLWSTLSGAALSLHFILWIASLEQTSVASSTLLVSLHPIFVGLGSHLFLKERISPFLLLGILLALVGGGMIGFGDLAAGGSGLQGDLLAGGGGLMAAVYFLIGRHVRRSVSAIEYIATSYGTAAVLTVVAAYATRTPLGGFSLPTYGYLVLLALIPQLIGHSTFNWALKHLSASKISVLVLGEPIGAAVLAYWIFNESLTGLNLAGAGVILVGIYLSLRSKEDVDVRER